MTRPTAFLINPDSATVKRKGALLSRISPPKGRSTYSITQFDHLPEIVTELAKSRTEWIFIESGDGTIQGVLSALMAHRHKFTRLPQITLVPGGLTNQIARNIGLKTRNPTKLEKLINQGPQIRQSTPLLQISLTNGVTKHGFLFSSGALPMATQYYFDNLHAHGKSGSLAVTEMLLKAFGGNQDARDKIYHPSPVKLQISSADKNISLEGEHLVSVVTTLPSLMLGLDPFWGNGDGPLRMTYIHGHAQKLLGNLMAVWAGRKHIDRKPDGFESFNTDFLRYDYEGPFVLDGEKFDCPDGRLEIRATEPIDFVS